MLALEPVRVSSKYLGRDFQDMQEPSKYRVAVILDPLRNTGLYFVPGLVEVGVQFHKVENGRSSRRWRRIVSTQAYLPSAGTTTITTRELQVSWADAEDFLKRYCQEGV